MKPLIEKKHLFATLALLVVSGCAPPTIPGADLVMPALAFGDVVAQGRIPGGALVLIRNEDEVHVVRVGNTGPEQVEFSRQVGTSFARLVTAPSGQAFVHSHATGLHRRSPDGTWAAVAVEAGSLSVVGTVDDLWLSWEEGEPLAHWDGVSWSPELLPGTLVQIGPDTFLVGRDSVRVREAGRWLETSLSRELVWSLASGLGSVAVSEDVTWVVEHDRIIRLSRRSWTANIVAGLGGRASTLSARVGADGELYVYRELWSEEVVCDHGGFGISRDAPSCGSPRAGYELVRWSTQVLSFEPDGEFAHLSLVAVEDHLWLAGSTHWWRIAR